MTVQFTCECCGRIETLHDLPDEVIQPPHGWRRIKTVIDEFDAADLSYNSCESEYLHCCDDCCGHVSIDKHIEADIAALRRSMRRHKVLP